MAIISTFYDQLISLVKTNYSTKTELVNPYDVSDNDDIILKDAFGIQIGPKTSLSVLNTAKNYERTITIVLARKIYSTERGISARQVAEKNILNDTESLINQVEGNKFTTINSIKFSGDSGILFVFGDRQSYIYNEISFNVNYSDFINTNC